MYNLYMHICIYGGRSITCLDRPGPWDKLSSARACLPVWPEPVFPSHLRFAVSVCCPVTAMGVQVVVDRFKRCSCRRSRLLMCIKA